MSDNLVAKKGGFGQIVRNEQNCLLKSRENFLQIALQIHPHEWIERGERLVEQKQLGRQHQCAHQTDALTLPAGKLERITIERVIAESE